MEAKDREIIETELRGKKVRLYRYEFERLKKIGMIKELKEKHETKELKAKPETKNKTELSEGQKPVSKARNIRKAKQ